MSRRFEHYARDIVHHNIEDEYVNLAIIPAKPRSSRHITGNKVAIAKHEVEQVIEEMKYDRV